MAPCQRASTPTPTQVMHPVPLTRTAILLPGAALENEIGDGADGGENFLSSLSVLNFDFESLLDGNDNLENINGVQIQTALSQRRVGGDVGAVQMVQIDGLDDQGHHFVDQILALGGAD